MKTALFTNFSNEAFTGFWNGKGKTFLPGQSVYMPDYLASHFAKHLVNRELLKKGLERSTSPKKPQDVPEYMELFNQAYTPDEESDVMGKEDSIDVQIAVANKNREKKAKLPEGAKQVNAKEPQVIDVPADDEDEEAEFGGKPVETTSNAPQTGATK
jgi:hypothetical protein